MYSQVLGESQLKLISPFWVVVLCVLLLLPNRVSCEPVAPLVVVMGEDTFPYQYIDSEGEPAGLLVDLWQAWARQTQSELVFVPRLWSASINQLTQGKADIHLGMAKTPAREAQFDFALPIADVNTFLYLHHTLPANKHSIHSLIAYQIGVVASSSHEAALLAQEPQLVLKRYPNREQLLQGVMKGEIVVFAGLEGYLNDPEYSRAIAAEFPKPKRILINKSQFSPALLKGNRALLQKVNRGFAELDPQWVNEIERRWLGVSSQQSGLVVAMQLGAEPFVDLGLDGLPHGMFVDMWRLWSEKTGINIEFMAGDMNQSVADVRRGLADAHIGYPESAQLKTGLKRAWPLYQVKSRLFTYQTAINQVADIKHQRVGVVPTAPYLASLREMLPDVSFRYYESLSAMVEGAKSGEIVGFVAASAWTSHYLLLNKNWADFHQFADIEFNTDIYVLTRTEDAGLANRIANGFNSIRVAELAEIEHKWMLNPKDHIFFNQERRLTLTPEEHDYLANLGKLTVGYLKHWAPMEYADENGQFAGINSDVAKRLAEQLQLKLTAVGFDDWHSLMQALIRGDVMLAASMAKTADRQQMLTFSNEYWPAPWGLVSVNDSMPVVNLAQLAGKTVAVVEGYHLVAQLMNIHPAPKIVLVANTEMGLKAVNKGQADVFIDKVVTLASQLHKGDLPSLKMSLLSDLANQQSHLGINFRYNELVPLINKALALIDPHQQQQIHDHWRSMTSDTPRNQYTRLVVFSVAILVLLALVVGAIWWVNRRLKQEIEARIAAQSRLDFVANHDALTQLPNRTLLDDRFSQALLSHQRLMAKFAVLFIDIDAFKVINGKHGYPVGDELLLYIAQKLQHLVGHSDTVSRFGDDEFVVLLNQVPSWEAVTQVADSILHTFASPIVIQDKPLKVSVSIGLVMYPYNGDTAMALLKQASQLMSEAKHSGGHCYRRA